MTGHAQLERWRTRFLGLPSQRTMDWKGWNDRNAFTGFRKQKVLNQGVDKVGSF